KRLIEECNLTQEQMADRVGKKRTSVTNFLRLLKLPASVQSSLREGLISMGHAKCLLSLEKESDMEHFSEMAIKKEWSVHKLEDKIKAFLLSRNEDNKPSGEEPELPESYYRLLDRIGKFFNNNVTVKRDAKGCGRITVSFDNDAQVEEFLKVMENA
ncbi:MAG: chromosome partitioning protein ParB, partial [Alistipes sp.]|nr:chromosome partitioning protein ParB [Candidatus Minthomonas equi]